MQNDDKEEEDEVTYANYKANGIRQRHPSIRPHPDPLVETASLSSVPLPEITFEHSLDDLVFNGTLSEAQLESVVYASQKFHGPKLPSGHRAGFFLGDGAGVGKGRQIAALIKQHWEEGGTQVLWVSVSNDLRRDAERDLRDIGAMEIDVNPKEDKFPQGELLYDSGVLFVTYSLLSSGLKKNGYNADPPPKKRGRRAGGSSSALNGGGGSGSLGAAFNAAGLDDGEGYSGEQDEEDEFAGIDLV